MTVHGCSSQASHRTVNPRSPTLPVYALNIFGTVYSRPRAGLEYRHASAMNEGRTPRNKKSFINPLGELMTAFTGECSRNAAERSGESGYKDNAIVSGVSPVQTVR